MSKHLSAENRVRRRFHERRSPSQSTHALKDIAVPERVLESSLFDTIQQTPRRESPSLILQRSVESRYIPPPPLLRERSVESGYIPPPPIPRERSVESGYIPPPPIPRERSVESGYIPPQPIIRPNAKSSLFDAVQDGPLRESPPEGSKSAKTHVQHKPRGADCLCWFRTLGMNLAQKEQTKPSPIVLKTDSELNMAKRNLKDLYQPLKPWQTRIITILAAKSSDPLCCNLWIAELIDCQGVAVSGTSDVVTYYALSYSWGSCAPTDLITCNGATVLVNNSLASALIGLRKEQEDIRIWCDGLCINQADPVEKAQQVRSMLRIFEKAHSVIAWIGPFDRWTKPLFDVLNDAEVGDLDLIFRSNSSDGEHNPECLRNIYNIIAAAGEHLERPWFRRTWVRQEVFGTSNLKLYCGGETTSLPGFLSAIRRISGFEQRLLSNSLQAEFGSQPGRLQVTAVPASVSVLANSYQHAGTDRHDYEPPRQRLRHSAHWLRVLNEGVDFEETDPRDKVYGVLGIITSPTTKLYVESRPDIQRAEFPISYTKSVSEVYQDVVKYLINLDRNLDVLQIFESRRNRAKDLPSWVTDWRQCNKRSIVHCAPDDKPQRERIGQAPVQDLNDYGKLRLKGARVGTPLELINALSNWDQKADIFPDVKCMDTNYVEMIESDCFVLGMLYPGPTFRRNANFLVPREAKLDDIVVTLLGGSCFFLLRPRAHDEYKFLGPVVGLSGDCLHNWSDGQQTFVLV